MGLKPAEVKVLTMVEFELMLTGYQERQDELWDMTRHVMWSVISYGGMGLKKPISAQEVMGLSKDNRNRKRYIINEFQAKTLIQSFYR